MIPGKHYKKYDIWGDVCPPEAEVDALCSFCLKSSTSGAAVAPPPLEEVSESDSSSSSVGSGGAPKRARSSNSPVLAPSVGPDTGIS